MLVSDSQQRRRPAFEAKPLDPNQLVKHPPRGITRREANKHIIHLTPLRCSAVPSSTLHHSPNRNGVSSLSSPSSWKRLLLLLLLTSLSLSLSAWRTGPALTAARLLCCSWLECAVAGPSQPLSRLSCGSAMFRFTASILLLPSTHSDIGPTRMLLLLLLLPAFAARQGLQAAAPTAHLPSASDAADVAAAPAINLSIVATCASVAVPTNSTSPGAWITTDNACCCELLTIPSSSLLRLPPLLGTSLPPLTNPRPLPLVTPTLLPLCSLVAVLDPRLLPSLPPSCS